MSPLTITGHSMANDFCVVTQEGNPTYIHCRTGQTGRIASYNGNSLWLIMADGTKNNFSMDVFDREFVLLDEQTILCVHCGFLPAAKGDNLCENCQGTGAV